MLNPFFRGGLLQQIASGKNGTNYTESDKVKEIKMLVRANTLGGGTKAYRKSYATSPSENVVADDIGFTPSLVVCSFSLGTARVVTIYDKDYATNKIFRVLSSNTTKTEWANPNPASTGTYSGLNYITGTTVGIYCPAGCLNIEVYAIE